VDRVGLGLYLLISFFLVVGLYGSTFFLGSRAPNLEKGTGYECGFDPFQDSRIQFEVRFYLVAILFILFDIEVSFLLPWGAALLMLSKFELTAGVLFVFLLTAGYVYEWKIGALSWLIGFGRRRLSSPIPILPLPWPLTNSFLG
jgi:NADH-quinone oxidoreductase subunit A